MDQPRWIPQLYGYIVCLVAVITMLLSVSSLVNNIFEYSSPEMSHQVTGEFGGRSLEACKQRYTARTQSTPRPAGQSQVGGELPADSALLRICAEDREDSIEVVRHRAMRALVTSSFMLLLSLVLFGVHWRWLRASRTAMT